MYVSDLLKADASRALISRPAQYQKVSQLPMLYVAKHQGNYMGFVPINATYNHLFPNPGTSIFII
jgi:hypothetical protein